MFDGTDYRLVPAQLRTRYNVYEDGNHILNADWTVSGGRPAIKFTEPGADDVLYKAVWEPASNTYRVLSGIAGAEMYSVARPWSDLTTSGWEILNPEGTTAARIRARKATRKVAGILRGSIKRAFELESPGGDNLASLTRDGLVNPSWNVSLGTASDHGTSNRMAVLSSTVLGMRVV